MTDDDAYTAAGRQNFCCVKVVIDKVNGKIKLQGLLSNVSDAVSEANDIIRSADHAKQTGQIEKIVTDMVQWYYLEEDKAKNKKTHC
jgi:hypothetical protein